MITVAYSKFCEGNKISDEELNKLIETIEQSIDALSLLSDNRGFQTYSLALNNLRRELATLSSIKHFRSTLDK